MTTTSISALAYAPIPPAIAERARRTLVDDFGHELRRETTIGPCRVCLRISKAPEDLILLSYRPIADRNPYSEVGPIFIHARDCEPYALDTFPEDFLERNLVVRAYDLEGNIFDAVTAGPGEAEAAAARFLCDANVEEVHVRAAAYTCFAFKIVRK